MPLTPLLTAGRAGRHRSGAPAPPRVARGTLAPCVGALEGYAPGEAQQWSAAPLPSQASSAQPTSPGLTPQAPAALASVPDSRLLLPGDFTGARPGPGSATAGVYLKPLGAVATGATPSTQALSIRPGSHLEGLQATAPVTTGHADLEAELEGIQQQLQDYQATKENLQ